MAKVDWKHLLAGKFTTVRWKAFKGEITRFQGQYVLVKIKAKGDENREL